MWSSNLVSTLELMPSVMAGSMDWLLSQIGLEDVSGSNSIAFSALWALARIKQQLCTFFPFFLGLEPGGYLEVMLQQVNELFLSSPNAGYEPWNNCRFPPYTGAPWRPVWALSLLHGGGQALLEIFHKWTRCCMKKRRRQMVGWRPTTLKYHPTMNVNLFQTIQRRMLLGFQQPQNIFH